MRNIKETIGKLFTAVALAAILAGTTYALPSTVNRFENSQRAEKKVFSAERFNRRKQVFEEFEKLSPQSVAADEGTVSEINQTHFMLGHYLMRTVYDFMFSELEGEGYESAAEDIQVLSGFFKGKPEADLLAELLKSVEAGTVDMEDLIEVIAVIKDSYKANLKEDENWFLLYGEWTTCLLGDIHLNDDEYIAEDLAKIKFLADNAPAGVGTQILNPVGRLSRFIKKTVYTEEDYEEMSSVVFDIFDVVLGEN